MTETAAVVIRQSKGVEDSISLTQQRDEVTTLAEELAGEVEPVDFGVFTGFSIHMKGDDDERIDNHPKMLDLLDDLRDGEYDYLCAYDDTRLARDQFYWEIERAAEVGGCEIEYVKEPPEDHLTFRVQRAVESEVKIKEIEKAAKAVEIRKEQGFYQGRPPTGLTFDESGEHLKPEPEEWGDVCRVFELRDRDHSYREIADDTGLPKSTIADVLNRGREFYEEYGEVRSRSSRASASSGMHSQQ